MVEHRVLLLDGIDDGVGSQLRRIGFEVVYVKSMEISQLVSEIARFEMLAVRSATKVTREVLTAGKNLLLVGRAGTGMDNIDVAAANELGILAFNTPGANARSVAECVIGQIISALHKISVGSIALARGEWAKDCCQGGRALEDKTVGIVGMGYIGKWVARLLEPFGVKVITYEFNVSTDLPWIPLVPFDQLVAESDVITLHVPLNDQTKLMINQESLSRVKNGAVLVNFARGGLVDDKAVLAALQSGQLASYVADTFNKEPLPSNHSLNNPELIAQGRLVLTPHLSVQSVEAQASVGQALVEQTIGFFQYGQIPWGSPFPQIPFPWQEKSRLIVLHCDQPGVAASILGLVAPANIARSHTDRSNRGGTAYTVVDADQKLEADQIQQIRALSDVLRLASWSNNHY